MVSSDLLVFWRGPAGKWVDTQSVSLAQERYGLTAQIRRAALSVGSNLAEGVIKRSPAEFARFLDMSLGSLSELSYQLRAARDIGILAEVDSAMLVEKQQEAGRLTWGLYAATRQRAAAGRS